MNPSEKAYRQRKQLQTAFGLTPDDAESPQVKPNLDSQPQPKPEDLKLYEEMFAEAVQRQYPLHDIDRTDLHYFQQVFHLRDQDVREIERRVMGDGEPRSFAAEPLAYPTETEQTTPPPLTRSPNSQPPATASPQLVDAFSGESSTTPTRNQAAIQGTLKQKAEKSTVNLPSLHPGQTQPPHAASLSTAAETSASPAVPADDPPRSSAANTAPETTFAQPSMPPASTSAPASAQTSVSQAPANAQVEAAVPRSSVPPQATSAPVSAVAAVPGQPPSTSVQPEPRPVIDRRLIFPLFGFLMGLTVLGVAWWMLRPSLPTGQADPQKAQQYVKWGTEKTQQGELQEGLNDFNDAIRLNPNDVNAYINRGFVKHQLRDLNGATADYTKAIELDPNSAQAASNLSHVQFDQGKYDEAAKSATRAIELRRDLPEAHLNLGNARSGLGDLNGAVTELRQAVQLKASPKTQARAYNSLGNVLARQNQLDQAIQNYSEATQRDATYADAFYNRAIAYARQTNNQSAVQDLNKAAELYQAQGNNSLSNQAKQKSEQLQKGLTSTPLPPAAPNNPNRSI